MNKRPLSLTSSSSSGSILNTTTTTNNNNNIDNNNSYDSSSNNDHQHKSISTTSPQNFATSNLLSPKKHQAQQLRKKFLPERPSNPSGSPHPKAVFCNSNNSFIRNSMYNGDFGAGNLQKMKKYSSEGSINLETSSSSSSTSSLSFDKSVVFNKFLSNLNILDSFEFKFSFESVHRNIQKAGSIADMIESKSSSEKTNYLLKIIEELLETEKNYVEDLQNIIKEYKQPIGSCKKFGQMNKNCDVIFSNIEELLKFNSSLLNQLNACEHDPEKISLTFVENNKGFYLYATYCSDYPTSLELIKRCMKSATTASHVHDMQKKLNHRLPLVSYLLKPVQRISKYHLFLQNMKSCCSHKHDLARCIEQAIQSMNTVLNHINQSNNQRTLNYKNINNNKNNNNNNDSNNNNSKGNINGNDGDGKRNDKDNTLSPDVGELMLKEKFFARNKVTNEKTPLFLFLFTRSILLARKKNTDKYLVKILFKTSDVMLIEKVPNNLLSFILISIHDPTQYLKLEARSEKNKFHCCHQLKKVIRSDVNNLSGSLASHINKIIQVDVPSLPSPSPHPPLPSHHHHHHSLPPSCLPPTTPTTKTSRFKQLKKSSSSSTTAFLPVYRKLVEEPLSLPPLPSPSTTSTATTPTNSNSAATTTSISSNDSNNCTSRSTPSNTQLRQHSSQSSSPPVSSRLTLLTPQSSSSSRLSASPPSSTLSFLSQSSLSSSPSPFSRTTSKRKSFINCDEGLGDRISQSHIPNNGDNTNYLFTLKIPKSKKTLKEKLNLSSYKEAKCKDACLEGCSGVYKKISDASYSNNNNNNYYFNNNNNNNSYKNTTFTTTDTSTTNNTNNVRKVITADSASSDLKINKNNNNNNNNNSNNNKNIRSNNDNSDNDSDTSISLCQTFDFYYENKLLDDLEGISGVHQNDDDDDDDDGESYNDGSDGDNENGNNDDGDDDDDDDGGFTSSECSSVKNFDSFKNDSGVL